MPVTRYLNFYRPGWKDPFYDVAETCDACKKGSKRAAREM